MTGQLWSVPASGGYLYSDELSETLRIKVQPLTKFRQFADAEDGSEKGLHRGATFYWDVVSDVGTQGHKLNENEPMPETNFTITQHSLTVTEFGNSVPYTGKLDALAKKDVASTIDKSLKHDARKSFDYESWYQFDQTPFRCVGTAAHTITFYETAASVTADNNAALDNDHVKAISDEMKERNIPPYGSTDDYYAISHPSTYRSFKNDLEDIYKYTGEGLGMIMYGEVGRYESIRFIEQNFIPKGGAKDSTTFNALTGTADAWDNGKSSWAYFFGGDTITEAICIPEEIRAKIPGDYGRSRGIAWYYLGGFALVHPVIANARVLKWDSAS